MHRIDGYSQQAGDAALVSPTDENEGQPTPNHPHIANDRPMVKPLICSFFKRAPATVNVAGVSGRSNGNTRPATGAAGSPTRAGDGSPAATPSNPSPQFPPPMDEAILLFPLTPSVKVPLRHSRRSGRVLNESETLQERHAQEYRFIVPMLAYAIECTIAAHEEIRKAAGLPAYISPSSSPTASPTRRNRTSAEAEESGAADDGGDGSGRPRVSSLDSAASVEERNSAFGYRVFQTAINSFSTREVPAISVHDYLKRIVKYTYVSPSVLVCCCLYIDRLLAMYPSFLLHPNNVFKFLITSTRVCSKIMDTRTLNNRDFSVVGGVTNEDINALEFMFVQLLQNRLYISHHTFDVYCEPLRRQAAHVDVEGEWDGTTLAMVLPVNGGRPTGYAHQPSRPSLARNSAYGGSVTSRSRRSSIVSQNEYSLSMASQSGVSPLRSASRPAFPPSASMGQSISVDGEFLAQVRQPSAAPSRGESAATSARRYMVGNANNGSARSPVLPQVHAATVNGVASSTVVPVIRNASSAVGLRSSGNFEDTNGAFTHSATGAFMSQLQHQQAVEYGDDSDDARARSIPVSGPRGISASWDTARTTTATTTRALAATTGGVGTMGLSTSAINARCGSPTTLPAGGSASMLKSRSLDGVTVSTEDTTTPVNNNTISGERTPTRRAFVSSARGDSVALPPVPQSGRRGRSGSFAGNSGANVPNVPPPPEFRQR